MTCKYSELSLRWPRLRWISRYYVQKQNPRLRPVGIECNKHRFIRTIHSLRWTFSPSKSLRFSKKSHFPKSFQVFFSFFTVVVALFCLISAPNVLEVRHMLVEIKTCYQLTENVAANIIEQLAKTENGIERRSSTVKKQKNKGNFFF